MLHHSNTRLKCILSCNVCSHACITKSYRTHCFYVVNMNISSTTHTAVHTTQKSHQICARGNVASTLKNYKCICICSKTHVTTCESSCTSNKQHCAQEHVNNIMSTNTQTHKINIMCMHGQKLHQTSKPCTGKCCINARGKVASRAQKCKKTNAH